jgi:hypothetical protein
MIIAKAKIKANKVIKDQLILIKSKLLYLHMTRVMLYNLVIVVVKIVMLYNLVIVVVRMIRKIIIKNNTNNIL